MKKRLKYSNNVLREGLVDVRKVGIPGVALFLKLWIPHSKICF